MIIMWCQRLSQIAADQLQVRYSYSIGLTRFCLHMSFTPGAPVEPKGFAMSFIQAAVRGRVELERASRNPRQELEDYINSPLEINISDPVRWWGVCRLAYLNVAAANYDSKHHQSQYPTLAKIARDYLAIQGSSVASERAFSSGGMTDAKARNQLSTEMFEALQILKSCYRDGLMNVDYEVAQHSSAPWTPIITSTGLSE